jgi:hypothetical protein
LDEIEQRCIIKFVWKEGTEADEIQQRLKAFLVIRAMPLRQSTNGYGTVSWGSQKFAISIGVGGLLSVILATILCFYCVLLHSVQFALLLKLWALAQGLSSLITMTLSVSTIIIFVACRTNWDVS